MTSSFTLHEKDSWHLGTMASQTHSFIAGKVLADIADTDERIVVLTADLGHSNRTIEFGERHPNRFFNMGIAEHNMVSVAAGLAATGFVPYVATFASFLALLCCEQIRTDLAYTNLPVRLLGHHAGISLGYYGTSHHATEDIAIMNSMANMKIVCPADAYSLQQALLQTVNVEGPIYFRLGRGRDPDVYQESNEWKFGRISVLRDDRDALIISNGLMVSTALQAASILKVEGINLTVTDLHTIKPLDKKGLLSLLGRSSMVFVVEEHNTMGGVASVVADAIVESNIQDTRLHRLGLPPDEYAIVGPPYYLYKHYKLDADSLAEQIRITLQKER